MAIGSGPSWSVDVEEADWISSRLTGFGQRVTSVVPTGFEAYARLLHPAEAPRHGRGRVVRWRDVSDWSGMPLRPDGQFHSIALPPVKPDTSPPWRGQGPRRGSLYLPDAQTLAEMMRGATTTPERCWFCVWDGYGWNNRVPMVSGGDSSEPLPDPAPERFRRGPRVRLPCRDYLLFDGSVDALAALYHLADSEQTPNLWWPEDRAWFVGTEIDLPWTYVAGSRALIDQLVAHDRIEVMPAAPDDPGTRVEAWVQRWVDEAVDALLETGKAEISTPRGIIEATMTPPGRLRHGDLRTRVLNTDGGHGTGWTRLGASDAEDLRRSLEGRLIGSVIGLVGG